MKKGDCKKINYFIIIILGLFIIISTNYYKIGDLITQNSDIKEPVEIGGSYDNKEGIYVKDISNGELVTQKLEFNKNPPKTCLPKEEVKIYTYMYHYIRNKNWDKPNAGFIRNAVITENFDAQMKKFSELENNKTIKIVFLSDLEKFQKEDCYPHKNLVILTSDDGWDDNYINLYPIAKKYNTKFHLSIISSYTKENRYDNFMTKAEVQEVSLDPNFEIIGHTFAHIDLRNLNDFYLSRELCSSKDSLELMTETQINTIIYPAGKYNSQTINKSKICGYKYGFTTKSGINTVKDLEENPFELKRIRVSRDTKVQTLTKYFEQKKTD